MVSQNTEQKATRKRPNTTGYVTYIYKVLKQTHPELGISKKAMNIIDSFVKDMFQRIATESGRLARYSKKHTISAKEVKTATRMLLPQGLSDHAVSNGLKAVITYNDSLK